MDGWQWLRVFVVSHGVANLEVVDAHQCDDVTSLDGFLGAFLAQAFESVEFLDGRLGHGAVAFHQRDVLSGLQGAAFQTTHGDTTDVGAVVQRGNQHLWRAFFEFRGRDGVDDDVQEVGDVVGDVVPVVRHPALLRRAIDGGEVQLVFGGAKVEHQVEDSLLHFVGTTIRFVHLVDNHDGFQAQLDGLLQHETGLRHGAFESVD